MSSAGDGRPENPELVSREDIADSCTVVSDGEGDMQWLEATCLLVSKVQAVRHWVRFLVFKVWFLNAKFSFSVCDVRRHSGGLVSTFVLHAKRVVGSIPRPFCGGFACSSGHIPKASDQLATLNYQCWCECLCVCGLQPAFSPPPPMQLRYAAASL